MENSKKEVQNKASSTIISICGGIVSVILMVLLTGKTGYIMWILYFVMPAIVIGTTMSFYFETDFLKYLLSFFTGKDYKYDYPNEQPDKKYGRAAIPISIALYGVIGFFIGLYWNDMFIRLLLTYLVVGAVWGYCVYIFFQKRYFHHDDGDMG